jgi:hypothetical protein
MVGSAIGFCYTVLFDCSRVLGVAKDLKKFVHDDQQEWLYKRNVFR